MPSLTATLFPDLWRVLRGYSQTIPANLIAVGINPGQAWANVKIALALESSQMQNGYQIIRISENNTKQPWRPLGRDDSKNENSTGCGTAKPLTEYSKPTFCRWPGSPLQKLLCRLSPTLLSQGPL